MAVLEKIRVKFGLAISIIIALALLSFIIDPNTLGSAINSMSSKYDVGQIAGKSISYTDFQADIDRYTTINQLVTGSSVQNEQAQEQIRDAAWQELLNRYMFIKYAKEAGVKVGEEELVEVLKASPVFSDEDGNFSPEAFSAFQDQLASDETGQLKTYWNYLQNSAAIQQYYAKYGALFNVSGSDNALTIKDAVEGNNRTSDINYVVAHYPFAKDSSIVVSKKEIKSYYKDHQNFYKQQASRDAEYVVFQVVPSAQDVAEASESFAKSYEEFKEADNMKVFLLGNSDRSFSTYWYKAGELKTVSQNVSDFVDASAPGAVSPIYQEGNSFFAVKVMAQDNLPDNISVRVMAAPDATEPTDSLVTALRLTEPMQMTQTYLIPGCEPLFSAPVGKPQIVKSLQYGTILAEVVEKSEPVVKKQVAILEKATIASKATFNEYYSQANNFATLTAGTYEGYKKALDSTKVYSHPMNRVSEATSTYGSIENAKEVTRWIFDNKPGKASGIITVNQNYFFVVAVKGVHKEGIAPLDEVSSNIETRLYTKKMHEKVSAEVAQKIEGKTTLEEVAEALDSKVQTAAGVAFASMNSQVEPALAGAVSVAEQGKVTGPVTGQIGVYVFEVTGVEEGSFFTEEDAKQATTQKNQYNSQVLIPVMMDIADVKDNRARFF